MMNFMYGEHKKESGSVVCPDDSCRIDPEKLRAAQARFGTRITRVVKATPGGMVVTIFSKIDCPVCDEARAIIQSCVDELGEGSALIVRHFDLDTAEGLVEGSLRNALEVPTTILEWQGEELVRWEQAPPSRDILMAKILVLPSPVQ